MYVAVKGGETAIANAHKLLADRRRGDRSVPALRLDQIVEQLGLAVDRAMGEGSLYDKELAALALVLRRGPFWVLVGGAAFGLIAAALGAAVP